MKAYGGAALAAAIVVSIMSGSAQARETRITMKNIDWSNPEQVESLHKAVYRAAVDICTVPNVRRNDINECIALTIQAAMAESGQAQLLSHYENCPNRQRFKE